MTKKLRLLTAVLATSFFGSGVLGLAEKSDGRFTFSTKSEQAKTHVVEVIQRIENFQFGGQVRPVAQKAVEADPEFAFAHYLVAATSPPSQAKPHMDKALELAKHASEGERRYIEAASLVQTQKPDEALGILQQLAQDYPQERMVQMTLGQISSNQGKFDQARAAFERALQIDGSTARAYALVGNVYLLQGNYGKAREAFKASLSRKAAGSTPNVPNYGLAFSYIYEGDVDSAIKALEAFRDEYIRTGGRPDLPVVFVWNSIARLLLENGRPEEALKTYEKGYESVPGSTISDDEKTIWLGRLHHGRGRSLARMGRYEEAWKEAELIKKMIDEGGEQGKDFIPAYHYVAGYVKLESGDIAAAIEHLKQADQTDPFRKLLLARAYEKAGDAASARKIYQEIVESTQNSIERALAYPEAKKKLGSS